jgi:molybdate transport system substrate-binding protein
VVVAVLLAGCATAQGPASSPRGVELTVFAAASLRDALTEAASAYRARAPDVSINLAFDASSTLRTQLEQGAPADLFLSADLDNARRLAQAGLTMSQPIPFASNSLAIVVPADQEGSIREPFDLARPGLRVVAAGRQVPISRYAERLLANLAAGPDAPAGFAQAFEANIVSREDNVRAVLAKIELGEGDAAIVYATDALGSDRVRTIPIPDWAAVSVSYGAVVMAGSPERAAADELLSWLRARDGQAVLARFGFGPPG